MRLGFLLRMTRFGLLGLGLLLCTHALLAQTINWKKIKVLVYTTNGVGFVHDNIENSIIALKAMGEQYGFSVDATEDPPVCTHEHLQQYAALDCSNTTNGGFAP